MASQEEYNHKQAPRQESVEYHMRIAKAASERAERGEALTTSEFRAKVAALTGSAIDEATDLSKYVEVE